MVCVSIKLSDTFTMLRVHPPVSFKRPSVMHTLSMSSPAMTSSSSSETSRKSARSDESSGITGQAIQVDGGLLAGCDLTGVPPVA